MVFDNLSCVNQALTGWVYYRISNAMQYSNTALETTALVMHDSNNFFRWYHFFLWLCEFHEHA